MEGGKNCIETVLFGTVCDDCNGAAIYQIIKLVIKIMTMGIGILAVLGIVVAGIVYLTSGDNVAKAQKAKRRIMEIVIGLAAYAALFAIMQFIIPGGIIEPAESCTEAPVVPQSSSGSGGSSSSSGTSSSAKYPWATVTGKASSGSIKCPRNADYTYTANPASGSKSVDKFFQSVAKSCPFSAVTYSDSAADEACAAGGTMHYDASKGWCLVNSKIDVYQYQAYLRENYIKQDGKTCTTDNVCSNSKEDNLVDNGACQYFARTFASNLNNGEVVSNDAYTAMAGIAAYDGFNGYTKFGNTKVTSNGREAMVYDDGLTGIWLTGLNQPNSTPRPLGYSGYETDSTTTALGWLRAGYAVSLGVHSTAVDPNPNRNCGHYLTAIGYTMSCAGGASCNANSLVVMNTNQEISTLGNTNWRIGYRRACTGP